MAIGQDTAEDVVIEALSNLPGLDIHREPRAAEMVVDDTVGAAILGDQVGHVRQRAVDVDGLDRAIRAQPGNRTAARVDEQPLQLAIHELGHAAVGTIDQVLDGPAISELDAEEVPELVVAVRRELPGAGVELGLDVARVRVALFIVQRFGTASVGRVFGPTMGLGSR